MSEKQEDASLKKWRAANNVEKWPPRKISARKKIKRPKAGKISDIGNARIIEAIRGEHHAEIAYENASQHLTIVVSQQENAVKEAQEKVTKTGALWKQATKERREYIK